MRDREGRIKSGLGDMESSAFGRTAGRSKGEDN